MPRTVVDKILYHAVLQCLPFGVLVGMAALLVCVHGCLWLLVVVGCGWLVGVEFGVGVVVCLLGVARSV